MKFLSSLIFLILFFQGCSQKTASIELSQKSTIAVIDDSDDEFMDEFEEEFEEEKKSDPFEKYNRVMTSFNDATFVYVINPVSKGYAYIIPEPVRVGVSNFFENIFFPIRFTNNILQTEFKNSVDEFNRFIINSTLGVFGVFDPASSWFKIKAHKEDFGQTLGYWGVGAGPHIVLPFYGPSNLRDAISLAIDSYIDPISRGSLAYKIPNNSLEAYGLLSFYYINKNSLNLGLYENIKKDALDLYPFLRDVYEQKREHDIKE